MREAAHEHNFASMISAPGLLGGDGESAFVRSHPWAGGVLVGRASTGGANQEYQSDSLTASLGHAGRVCFPRLSWRGEGTPRNLQPKLRAF